MSLTPVEEKRPCCIQDTQAGLSIFLTAAWTCNCLPHLWLRGADIPTLHVCMSENALAFFAPSACLYLRMCAYTSGVPAYYYYHLPHASVCSNTVAAAAATRDGNLSPLWNVHHYIGRIASVSILAVIITQASRRIMSPAAKSCQSDTSTACQL